MLLLLKYGGAALRHKICIALLAWPSALLADPVHILALGDSLTQGYGLPERDGFVPQLQNWLESQGEEVRVINGGVSGDTTAGGLARVAWSLGPEVDGMIVALGGNDLLRGVDPAQARQNLQGILLIAQEREVPVLLIGMQAPGNYGAEYKRDFDSIYPDLAQRFDTLYLDSFFAGLMSDGEGPAQVQAFMQPDGIHPNAQGVARLVSAIGPKVQDLVALVRP
jgi:acyl-CoA thioesterase-1